MARVKIRLLDETTNLAQQAIIGFWFANLAGVLVLWQTTAHYGNLAGWLDAIGMLLGLLATYFALTQFMLMGRIGWIERRFGLDHLASYHRINGYLAISCILLHPLFITASYGLVTRTNFFRQYLDLILHYNFVWLALISELLFIAVVLSTAYIVRKRLKFETWYFVHLFVYGAIIAAPFHQLTVGDSFIGDRHPLARAYWLSLYGFVALNLLIWRFCKPLWNFGRFGFTVERIVAETPTATSVYIRGKRLESWHVRPGQFVLVRFLSAGRWWQEHPFSVSLLPGTESEHFRLTIRHVGDFTTDITKLGAGTRVLVSGPFGRFTSAIAVTERRLFIAGGIGITPIRPLIAEALAANLNCELLYANRNPGDVALAPELKKLEDQGLKLINVYSEPSTAAGEQGYIDLEKIKRLAPDYKKSDVYLCGPPPMMVGLIETLTMSGLKPAQLHYERFALHA